MKGYNMRQGLSINAYDNYVIRTIHNWYDNYVIRTIHNWYDNYVIRTIHNWYVDHCNYEAMFFQWEPGIRTRLAVTTVATHVENIQYTCPYTYLFTWL